VTTQLSVHQAENGFLSGIVSGAGSELGSQIIREGVDEIKSIINDNDKFTSNYEMYYFYYCDVTDACLLR
jgi:hypothetical protein